MENEGLIQTKFTVAQDYLYYCRTKIVLDFTLIALLFP